MVKTDGAEDGQESQVGVGYDVDEDGGHPWEEHPRLFFPGDALNEVQQSLDDHLSQTLTSARYKLHFAGE